MVTSCSIDSEGDAFEDESDEISLEDRCLDAVIDSLELGTIDKASTSEWIELLFHRYSTAIRHELVLLQGLSFEYKTKIRKQLKHQFDLHLKSLSRETFSSSSSLDESRPSNGIHGVNSMRSKRGASLKHNFSQTHVTGDILVTNIYLDS
jgi:hypothetical protein